MTTRLKLSKEWKDVRKDNKYVYLHKERVAYDKSIGFWREIAVKVYETVDIRTEEPIFIVEYDSRQFPSGVVFKTKSKALAFAKEYLKKNKGDLEKEKWEKIRDEKNFKVWKKGAKTVSVYRNTFISSGNRTYILKNQSDAIRKAKAHMENN